jgi:hypothetical protein
MNFTEKVKLSLQHAVEACEMSKIPDSPDNRLRDGS